MKQQSLLQNSVDELHADLEHHQSLVERRNELYDICLESEGVQSGLGETIMRIQDKVQSASRDYGINFGRVFQHISNETYIDFDTDYGTESILSSITGGLKKFGEAVKTGFGKLFSKTMNISRDGKKELNAQLKTLENILVKLQHHQRLGLSPNERVEANADFSKISDWKSEVGVKDIRNFIDRHIESIQTSNNFLSTSYDFTNDLVGFTSGVSKIDKGFAHLNDTVFNMSGFKLGTKDRPLANGQYLEATLVGNKEDLRKTDIKINVDKGEVKFNRPNRVTMVCNSTEELLSLISPLEELIKVTKNSLNGYQLNHDTLLRQSLFAEKHLGMKKFSKENHRDENTELDNAKEYYIHRFFKFVGVLFFCIIHVFTYIIGCAIGAIGAVLYYIGHIL